MSDDKIRCEWASGDERMTKYHDEIWGRPEYDDDRLFEMLTLESMQSGLSWQTILNKKENFERAFDNFHIETVAGYNEDKYIELMQDAGIVRNRLKIRAAINNAGRILDVRKEFGSFDKYIWSFTNGAPLVSGAESLGELSSSTKLSETISKDLKKRGFRFVGKMTVYSFVQACGIVNDHLTKCFRYAELTK